jgi:hypothetical protein
MSFYPQPNKYQCGPFALKYSLVMLGLFQNEKNIAKIAGSTWWSGTDEIGLNKAAKRFNCSMKYFHNKIPTKALGLLNNELSKGYPVILCVDNWEHWLTVVNFYKSKYIIIDSGLDKVIQVISAAKLLKRWRCHFPDEDFISYDGYSVMPKFRALTKANFSPENARFIMHKNNEKLAQKWDVYFNDLISFCRPYSPNAQSVISFTEFLRRYEKLLISEVADWHGDPKYSELKQILRNMEFVANVYHLAVHEEDIKKAIIAIASILMMYSCGKYGMNAIYL